MRRAFTAAMILAAVLAAGARADGFIILPPPPGPGPTPVPLAVRTHRVTVQIRDQVAETAVDQVFHNPNDRVLEGTFIFPLPQGASVSKFSLFIDGRETEAELLDAGEARRIYEEIVRRMRDPALLEYAGRSLFRARIYPLPARGDRRIKLAYSEVLEKSGGLARYLYPLNTERFSSRPLEEVVISVAAESRVPFRGAYSPSHDVDVTRSAGGRRLTAGYEARDVRPNKDFVLYLSVAPDEVGLGLLSHRPDPTEDGYFLLLAAPEADRDRGAVLPKDVVFVFDSSGSMAGAKVEQARRALAYCLERLGPRDRFGLVRFATDVETFRDSLAEVDPATLGRAREFVAGFTARGGTNVDEALRAGLRIGTDPGRPEGRPLQVVFLTDGLPTIGTTDTGKILENAVQAAPPGVRLFVFGLGHDVNTQLLDLLAERLRGARTYVSPEEDIEAPVTAFFTKVSEPVLTDLALSIPGVRVREITPQRLPDLFAGGQLVLLGRYAGAGRSPIELSGRGPGGRRSFEMPGDFPERAAENDFLPRLWATRKIGYLLDEIRLHGESDELREEVVALARRHGIVTPYTSYLVVEDEKKAGPGADRPPAAPAFSNVYGPGGTPPEGLGGALRGQAKSGEAAFKAARSSDEMRQAVIAPESEATEETVRQAAGRTFYLAGGVWTDSRYRTEMPVATIRFGSDEYFRFAREHPELGAALALGPRVLVVAGERAIRIEE